MQPTRIKICGVTRPQDAQAAAQAGADAIGIIFYPKAKRCVSIQHAQEILRALPPFVTPVGLFVDQPVEEIKDIAGNLGLSHIQLHGHETSDIVAKLPEFKILKALRADREKLQNELELWKNAIKSLNLIHLQGLVLESPAAAMGGAGIENDWEFLSNLHRAGAFAGLPPIIAAGGLTPMNVGNVVKMLNPYAVDVSSGVEQTFGEKSAEKINAFVSEVARASRP